MDPEYKGIKVGVEIELGNTHLSQLTIVMILLEEIRQKHPKEFKIASKAIEENES